MAIDYTYARYLLKGEIAETVKKLNSLLDELETTGIGVVKLVTEVGAPLLRDALYCGCKTNLLLSVSETQMQNLSLLLNEMCITTAADENGTALIKIPTEEGICIYTTTKKEATK